LLQLVFSQLANSDEESMIEAVNVVVELITLSRKDKYVEIKNFVLINIDVL
jgi:hypothetical protein